MSNVTIIVKIKNLTLLISNHTLIYTKIRILIPIFHISKYMRKFSLNTLKIAQKSQKIRQKTAKNGLKSPIFSEK